MNTMSSTHEEHAAQYAAAARAPLIQSPSNRVPPPVSVVMHKRELHLTFLIGSNATRHSPTAGLGHALRAYQRLVFLIVSVLSDQHSLQFVYPFTLEPHILTMETSRRSTLAAHTTRREAYLKSRDDERERRKREALRRIAPGFSPLSVPLIPMKRSSSVPDPTGISPDTPGHHRSRSVMDDLVDQLAALDANTSSS